VSSSLLYRGEKLGRYEVREFIGEGGMGEVYRAWDSVLQRDVAVKILTARDDEMLKRFEREAVVIGRLDNPNVVAVHDFSLTGEHPYIVMEYLRGETLKDRITRGAVPTSDAVNMALGVCAGVSACHSVGIIHRDLKLANVFLADTPHYGTVAKVLDFGVAKPAQYRVSDLTGPGKLVGTPRYIAPEQLGGAEADELSDQYGIGLLLYVALSGKPPFIGKQGKDLIQAILSAEYAPLAGVRSDVPEKLDAVIEKARNVERARRYASVQHLGRGLMSFLPTEEQELWRESFVGTGKERESVGITSTAVMPPEEARRLIQKSIEEKTTEVDGEPGHRQQGRRVSAGPVESGLSLQTKVDSSFVAEPRERTWRYSEDPSSATPSRPRTRHSRRRLDILLATLLTAAGVGLVAIVVTALGGGHRAMVLVSASSASTTLARHQQQSMPDAGTSEASLVQTTTGPRVASPEHLMSARPSEAADADANRPRKRRSERLYSRADERW
jgi:serine/threonine protein kinase